eukprot:TRINITY_DN9380_c0_g1_i3.p1 TRINITY_DN9380_c0_g1~~TRINITY_DN9380_c0_g1_i3.p1  ORF type:complete len:318 (+),score=81.65 TRINITY_DN9380_c0_g1_i3:392-1345(+)
MWLSLSSAQAPGPALAEHARGGVLKALGVLDQHLLEHTYFVGERVTLADIVLFCDLLPATGKLDAAASSKFTNVVRWHETVARTANFAAVLGRVAQFGPATTRLRLGFLASGGGSNFQAILDAIKSGVLAADACVLISNNSKAGCMDRARAAGVPAVHLSGVAYPPDPGSAPGRNDRLDAAIRDTLKQHGVNLVCLCGYMKALGPLTQAAFPHRVLNIHPSLLPRHGGTGMFGIHVHEAVLAAGDAATGATIHLVDGEYDTGAIVAQSEAVPVLPGDTPEALQARVLVQEHVLYASTLAKISRGEIVLETLRATPHL